MKKSLLATVFIAGLSTLGAEFAASRLLANTFGNSNLVWAAIIGLIMIYLAAGSFWGGRLADRFPHERTLAALLAATALGLGIVPLVAGPVLRFAAAAFDQLRLGVAGGAFFGVLLLFSLPITLLGMVSPFVIRLSIRDRASSGQVAGRISSLGTIGSFIGTYLTVLILIPNIGTARTIWTLSLLLGLNAAWLLLESRARHAAGALTLGLILLGGLSLWASRGPIKNTPGQIYEAESAYNYIEVLERDGYRYLRLNDGQGYHSIWSADTLNYNGPWSQFLAGPFFNAPPATPHDVQRIAIVGLAAGTAARQASAIFGPVPIDGYEIDPLILQVGREYFGLDALPNLNTYAQDGRWGLAHSPWQYDLIIVDAYRPPYIPAHLTTREFFQMAADHLTETGVLAINVGRAPDDRRLINALATTLNTVFPSVHVSDVPNSLNTIIYATREPTTPQNLVLNWQALNENPATHPLLRAALATTITYYQPAYTPSIVFTDDKAPIEWMTNNLILSFIVRGQVNLLEAP